MAAGSRCCAGPMPRTTAPRPNARPTGLIKLVVDRKARILGVSIAGAGAGEMINMWALAITNR
jgi:pyruvate/2-oxoglutarate dehydrogenase complex dihydrolipoamide dehydrogenase (E3) component